MRHPPPRIYRFGQAAPGGDEDKAINYTLRAAERSSQLLAYEEAARYYQRALQLLDLRPTDDPSHRFELTIALGQAQTRSSEMPQVRTTFERAAAIARQLGDADGLARAALGCAGALVTPGVVNERAVALLNEALAALGQADSTLRARLLGRLAMEYLYSPLRSERRALSLDRFGIPS